jgi:hypothetical protein
MAPENARSWQKMPEIAISWQFMAPETEGYWRFMALFLYDFSVLSQLFSS